MLDAITYIKAKAKPKGDRVEKISISLPRSLIKVADKAATDAGCSRSEVIKIALEKLIQEEVAQTA